MRTILLPGLGADAELFAPQREALGAELVVVAPAPSSPNESFVEAARRLAERLDSEGLTDGAYHLGGMSFGGSLALEVSRHLSRPPERLLLIASNCTTATIPRRFRVARSLGAVAPQSVAPWVLRRLARVFAWRERLDEEARAWLTGIAERVDVPLLLWGARAIAGWRFTEADVAALPTPVHQIHGVGDWVLPIHRRHVTLSLPDGRHLINRTHAELVNDWLRDPVAAESGSAAA